jgi:hypothetical protein
MEGKTAGKKELRLVGKMARSMVMRTGWGMVDQLVERMECPRAGQSGYCLGARKGKKKASNLALSKGLN